MKKLTLLKTLLVLIGVLITSVTTNVRADNKLKGSWDSWTEHTFSYEGSYGKVELDLTGGKTYEFGMQDGDDYYTIANTTITSSVTNWSLYKSQSNNLKITTGETGTYIFILTWDNGTPKLSVYYPVTETLYYAHANTENYTVKANIKVTSTNAIWKTVTMSATGNTFDGKKIYSCEVQLPGDGLKQLQFQRYDGSTHKGEEQPINNTWTDFSTIKNKVYVNYTTSKWQPLGVKRTYDGNTYIYWKTSGNNIPSGWDEGSGSHKIHLVKITDGNYVYQSWTAGEDIGDGFIRYRVPAGDYANIMELQGKNDGYSGEFGFSDNADHNLLWNYNSGGTNIAWSITYFARSAYVYLDNTGGYYTTASGYNFILIGRDGTSRGYELTTISNTKLLNYSSALSYNDFTAFRIIHATGNDWGERSESVDNRLGGAANYTASVPKLMDYGSKIYNMFTPASGSNDASLAHVSANSYANLLHSTQTVNIETSYDNGSSYSTAAKAPAKVTLHSYALTNATTSTASNATDIAVDATTVETTTTSVRTATTTVAYESKKVGYTFDGWYRDGVRKGTGTSYEYYPVADSTLTARFKAHRYTVVFNGSGKTSGSMDNQSFTYEVAQNLTTNAFRKEGYTFQGWATSPERAAAGTVDYGNGVDGSTMAQATSDNCTVNLYAVWEDDGTYYFDGNDGASTAWATPGNWTKGAVPSSTSDVIILKPVVVTAGEKTTVNSIKIATSGSYTPNGTVTPIGAAGKLTIPATAILVVTDKVQTSAADGSSTSTTTPATLHIESSSASNGTLIWGYNAGTPGSTPGSAQVDYYSTSAGSGEDTDINQYIGTPFSDESNYYNYYGAWVFEVDYSTLSWKKLAMGSTMDPWKGYCVIYNGDAGHTFQMEGELETNGNKSVSAPNATESVLANSWTAPIKIKAFEVGDFSGPNAAIYIFNSTSIKDSKGDGVGAGNYAVYSPCTSAGETDVIPSMQSFSVTGGTGTVSLNYERLIKTPAGLTNGPMHAPIRDKADEMVALKISVQGENGWGDELKLFEHEEFSYDFENGWDARKMYGDPAAPQMYAMATDGIMAINCVPTFDNNVIGFHAGTANTEYTFTFAYDGEDELVLNDTKLGIETPIENEGSYTFISDSEDSDMRFVIKKVPAIVTGIDDINNEKQTGIQKFMYNGALYIVRDGRIYSAEGTLVK